MDNNNPNYGGGQYNPQTDVPQASGPDETQNPQPESYRVSDTATHSDAPSLAQPSQPYTPTMQVNVSKKKSNLPLVAGLIAAVLLVVVAAGAYFMFNKLANRPAVSVEQLVPANTMAYVTVNTSPNGTQKAALDKIRDAFESQPDFKDAWTKLTEQASSMSPTGDQSSTGTGSASGISDFDSLSSYLGGNITLVVLPPSIDDLQKLKDASGTEGDPMSASIDVMGKNVVGIVDLDFNPLDKKGPLSELKKQADNIAGTEVVEKYRDVDIHKYISDTTTIYFALLNDTSTAVAGMQTAPLHAVIDQFKGQGGNGSSLKDDATFKLMAGQVPQDRLATLYINLTEIYKEVGIAAPEALTGSAVKGASGAMLVTVSAQDGGLQVDVASDVDVQGLGVQMNSSAKPDSSTLASVPADSLAFVLGTDLKDALKSTLDQFRKQSEGSDSMGMGLDINSMLSSMEQSTGVSLENDVLPLLGGDYALSASAKTDALGAPQPSVVFQVKLNAADHDKATATVDKLVNGLTGGMAEKLDTGAGTFYDLAPGGDMGVVLGVAKDRVLLVVQQDTTTATDQAKNIASGTNNGIGSTPQWHDASKHLPPDSNSVYYVDITGVRGLAESIVPSDAKQEYDQTAAPFLRPMKYLLVGSATQPTRDGILSRNHTVIFLGIAK